MRKFNRWLILASVLSTLWFVIYYLLKLINNQYLLFIWAFMVMPTLFIVFKCGERDSIEQWRLDK